MKTKTHVYLCTFRQHYSSQAKEKNKQMTTDDEGIKVTCSYNGLEAWKGGSVDTCFNMDETGKHHAESREPDKPDHMNILGCKIPNSKSTRERTSVCSCWSWGTLEENGKWTLIEVFFFLLLHLSKWLHSYVNMWKSVDTLNMWILYYVILSIKLTQKTQRT